MNRIIHNLYCRATGHNRGFGIHSPLAFSTITDAIHPRRKYGLYVYQDIHDMMCGAEVSLRHWRRVRRRARSVARLAVFFDLKQFIISGPICEPDIDVIRETLPLVGCREDSSADLPTLAVCQLGETDVLPAVEQADVSIVYGSRSRIKALKRTLHSLMHTGILYDGYNTLLLVRSCSSAFVEYKVTL